MPSIARKWKPTGLHTTFRCAPDGLPAAFDITSLRLSLSLGNFREFDENDAKISIFQRTESNFAKRLKNLIAGAPKSQYNFLTSASKILTVQLSSMVSHYVSSFRHAR